jgi:thiol-disulfide isomerase/thioredoxin
MGRALFCAIAISLLHCGGTSDTRSRQPSLLEATVEDLRGEVVKPDARAVVLNVWATWCAPCREEFPDLLRLRRAYSDSGLRLILVSADFEDQAGAERQFLAGQGVDFESYIKIGDDMAFIEGLHPRWTGALPATFVYDGRGRLRHFQEGRTTYASLEPRVLDALHVTDSVHEEASP